MKKGMIIALIVAACCLLIGGVIAAVGLLTGGANVEPIPFSKVTHRFEQVPDSFEIEVVLDDVELRLSPDGTCYIECMDSEQLVHEVTFEGGKLTVKQTDTRKWYEHIGIFNGTFQKIALVIYLPSRAYSELVLSTVGGDVTLPEALDFSEISVNTVSGNISVHSTVKGYLQMNTVSGNVFAKAVLPKSVTISTVSGDIVLEDVIVNGKCALSTTSGDVDLRACDAAQFQIKTTSGDVTGSILSEKIFITDTTSGNVHVPQNAGEERFEVDTTSGDIEITLAD
ncbi:MAG: DUF4097 family beta strand repeat protein [Clostridia bacterium]|nr:DUF4097 family beta strand repeat protein [Clostridia bacterium]